MEGNCSPDTAVEGEQAVAVADQKRQVPVPGKLVAGHILGTAEVVGVQSADYSLNTEYRTAAAAGGGCLWLLSAIAGLLRVLLIHLTCLSLSSCIWWLLWLNSWWVSCRGGGSDAVRSS